MPEDMSLTENSNQVFFPGDEEQQNLKFEICPIDQSA